MSRVGKKPISLPTGVETALNGSEVSVKGPKGTLTFTLPAFVQVKSAEGNLVVEPANDTRDARAQWGLSRASLQNLVTGVTEGFEKRLELRGVGYRASVQGKLLVLNLGYSHDVLYAIPDDIGIVCESQTLIVISGINKQKVGQVAAEIRSYRKPEPYKGKGIRYVGEYVRMKEGKKK